MLPLNMKKVPQLHVATGATKWNDPKNFPWTMGWQPNYQTEGRIYAKHILQTKPSEEPSGPTEVDLLIEIRDALRKDAA